MISSSDIDGLVARCATLPASSDDPRCDDYVENLLLAVLDRALHLTTVNRAYEYFHLVRHASVRTAEDLRNLLEAYPDDDHGNMQLAIYLFNMKFWNRARDLRVLFDFFDARGVTSQEGLRTWFTRSAFTKDFEGKIPRFSYASYQLFRIRLGEDTIKPDIHVKRFVKETIGQMPSDSDIVDGLERTARKLGWNAGELDRRIFAYQKGKTVGLS